MIRAGLRFYASAERCRLLERCGDGKMLFQGWMGRRRRMIHVEEGLLNWALERKWNLDSLNWGRRQRNGNGLNKLIEESGRHQASGFPAPPARESRLRERRTVE